MKKLIIVITLAIAACGCERVINSQEIKDGKPWVYHGRELCTKIVELDGHKYVIMDGFRCGGIIHASSCPCMAK